MPSAVTICSNAPDCLDDHEYLPKCETRSHVFLENKMSGMIPQNVVFHLNTNPQCPLFTDVGPSVS
jgi:hypothetical protein